jgi:hypothetical protein
MTVLLVLLGCIVVADYGTRLPARRDALAKARKARKASAALVGSSLRAQVELWVGLGIIAVGLVITLAH